MSIQIKFLSLVDVLLRVPPLFIIDELFRMRLGLPQGQFIDNALGKNESYLNQEYDQYEAASRIFHYDAQFYKLLLTYAFKFIISCFGCVAALCTFVLWTKHLLIVYMYLISGSVIFISYWCNLRMMKSVIVAADSTRPSVIEDILELNLNHLMSEESPGTMLLENFAAQCSLASIFCFVHLGPRYPLLQKLWVVTFLAPTFLATLPLPSFILTLVPVFAAVLPLAMVNFILWTSIFSVIETVSRGYVHARAFISDFGLSALMEVEWMRLNVPCVLRTFWILRLIEQAIALQIPAGFTILDFISMAKSLLTTGCETLTSVLGMTSVVSYLSHYIGRFVQWILLTDDEDDKSIGTVSAILFYILALQTGLTSLEPEKRFIRLCRNFCLLFTAILHFIHNIVNPLLMSLSASHNPALHKHVRALMVCLFLMLYPVGLVSYLWYHQPVSSWLLAVSAFSIEVVFKVIVSLLIYMLFLIDAHRATFWEKLDDYVYYIRAFGNTLEFFFGVFLFFNGAWILMFESGGAIRAGMMGIHAYFNIWCEAKAGWSVFMKRRTAVNKIDSLPEANESQLASLDDVCAICYQEMRTAKITKCKHFFHGVCLRKWLYVQDRCPLCHEILYKVEADKEGDEAEVLRDDGLAENAPVRLIDGR
ncbi:protein TRC8 homolog [Cimex lectularius]|uniref:RING-type domain-containing protein n=1 Tax=Cimex lectularius TaxID=79782 RepID=A0A8I6RDA8_CIMLE|nr:protein TRC8 homolog [Cimex lectularius]